jgi:hypothetical protein
MISIFRYSCPLFTILFVDRTAIKKITIVCIANDAIVDGGLLCLAQTRI